MKMYGVVKLCRDWRWCKNDQEDNEKIGDSEVWGQKTRLCYCQNIINFKWLSSKGPIRKVGIPTYIE